MVLEPTYAYPKKELTKGLILLAVIMLIFASWIYIKGKPSLASAQSNISYESPVTLDGFQSDAWFLPDEEMLGFILVPSGPFLMGGTPPTDPLAFDNERWNTDLAGNAQGTVELSDFYIGRYEVTVAQFGIFAQTVEHPVFDETLTPPPNHPVANVSWPDALAYCRWLEAELRAWPRTPKPLANFLKQGGHVTLPNEAQWEKAARGTDGRIYPWGSEARQDRANYGSTNTAAVGSYECPECPFDLADTSGNVWEWTRSLYHQYPFNPIAWRTNPDTHNLWVIRGGSFTDTARNIRTSIRGRAGPDVRRPFLGFRIALSLKQ